MEFDIPINVKVATTTEKRAEDAVFNFLRKAMRDYGTDDRIVDWEYLEFPVEESHSSGCGNNDQEQWESENSGKHACNCTIKEWPF